MWGGGGGGRGRGYEGRGWREGGGEGGLHIRMAAYTYGNMEGREGGRVQVGDGVLGEGAEEEEAGGRGAGSREGGGGGGEEEGEGGCVWGGGSLGGGEGGGREEGGRQGGWGREEGSWGSHVCTYPAHPFTDSSCVLHCRYNYLMKEFSPANCKKAAEVQAIITKGERGFPTKKMISVHPLYCNAIGFLTVAPRLLRTAH